MKKIFAFFIGLMPLSIFAQQFVLDTGVVESKVIIPGITKAEEETVNPGIIDASKIKTEVVDSNVVEPMNVETNVVGPSVVAPVIEPNVVASTPVEEKSVNAASDKAQASSGKKWNLGIRFKGSYVSVPKFLASADSIHRTDIFYLRNERNPMSEANWEIARTSDSYTVELGRIDGFHIELGAIFDFYFLDKISLVSGVSAGLTSLGEIDGLKVKYYNIQMPILIRYDLPNSFWIQAGVAIDFIVKNKFEGIDRTGCPEIDSYPMNNYMAVNPGCTYDESYGYDVNQTGTTQPGVPLYSGYRLYQRVAFDNTNGTRVREYNSSVKVVPNLTFGLGKTFYATGMSFDVGFDMSYGIKAWTSGIWFKNVLEIGGHVTVGLIHWDGTTK